NYFADINVLFIVTCLQNASVGNCIWRDDLDLHPLKIAQRLLALPFLGIFHNQNTPREGTRGKKFLKHFL
ncbi:hypothetical protein, partial [Enterobacter cloacae complex sp. 4DZ1-17B1]|uniref:hypothetical protein n=1 Tax=Enterobacter cloacae complex sp. 4DZ1-17B1 TaxID=2511991 RepID=UPI001CA4B9D1